MTIAGTPQRVTKLKLTNKSLTGAIPERLSDLDGLNELKLSGNSLTGCIPVALKDVASHDLDSLGLLYCRPPAPGGLTGTAAEHSTALSWDAVTNSSRYRVEHRQDGTQDWTLAGDTLTGTTHTVERISCGTDYQFRVSAYGSGTVYAAAWSGPSAVYEASTTACITPTLDSEAYGFEVDSVLF